MKRVRHILKALSIACLTLVVLLYASTFLWREVIAGAYDIQHILLGMMFFSAALISVNVFQLVLMKDRAQRLASGMSRKMIFSSQQLFSRLYMESPVPYLLISPQGEITSANRAAARLFHSDETRLTGASIHALVTDSSEQNITFYISKMKAGLFVNDQEVSIMRTDNAVRWVLLSLFPFLDTHGQRLGLLTLIDVTKQKEIDRAKSEFVSLASHQLQTPLTAMKWNMELLQMQSNALDRTSLQYIEKVHHHIIRMSRIVDDFLNVSKLELGTLYIESEDVSITALVQEVVDEFSEQAQAKQIQIEWSNAAAQIVIRSDRHFLRMAVSNLVSNAIKYTPHGGNISTRVLDAGQQVQIEVADTGIGIPQDEQDRIFTKVFRASNAKEQESVGTGLGLYIVKKIAETLGGSISFTSAESTGTTFVLTLPRHHTAPRPE